MPLGVDFEERSGGDIYVKAGTCREPDCDERARKPVKRTTSTSVTSS